MQSRVVRRNSSLARIAFGDRQPVLNDMPSNAGRGEFQIDSLNRCREPKELKLATSAVRAFFQHRPNNHFVDPLGTINRNSFFPFLSFFRYSLEERGWLFLVLGAITKIDFIALIIEIGRIIDYLKIFAKLYILTQPVWGMPPHLGYELDLFIWLAGLVLIRKFDKPLM